MAGLLPLAKYGSPTPLANFGSHPPNLPPTILNTLSSISVSELGSQYLCDPQWFRYTASRGFTTLVTPKTHFRTYPSEHDSIVYQRTRARGESSTMKHRLLHESGPHPIPPPDDPNGVAEIVLPVKIWHHTITTHMANQIKRHNVSSLTYENFPGDHPSQYRSHPCTLNSREWEEEPKKIRKKKGLRIFL
ncbi:hypothetical protein F511_28163 [Dorcoceras hygrometricum]|uniref:Uncharacterized protein n=1 Tax=Dorcoceras hygrometricum TaxID=472368 RepID=A0A2Z7BYF0_9LAMI|nr:hypothetical protein F511_28163 [Dorcoceras hygrometricum]